MVTLKMFDRLLMFSRQGSELSPSQILDRCNADARSARQFLLRELVLRAELGDLFADHGITSIAIPYTTTGKKKGCYHEAKTFASSYPREEWMPSYEQEKFFAVRTRAGAPEHGGRFPPL